MFKGGGRKRGRARRCLLEMHACLHHLGARTSARAHTQHTQHTYTQPNDTRTPHPPPQVVTEILDSLALGDYEIKLNHRGLLDAMLAIAGGGESTLGGGRDVAPRRASGVGRASAWPWQLEGVLWFAVKLPTPNTPPHPPPPPPGPTPPPATPPPPPRGPPRTAWEAVRREKTVDKVLPGDAADAIGRFVVLRWVLGGGGGGGLRPRGRNHAVETTRYSPCGTARKAQSTPQQPACLALNTTLPADPPPPGRGPPAPPAPPPAAGGGGGGGGGVGRTAINPHPPFPPPTPLPAPPRPRPHAPSLPPPLPLPPQGRAQGAAGAAHGGRPPAGAARRQRGRAGGAGGPVHLPGRDGGAGAHRV